MELQINLHKNNKLQHYSIISEKGKIHFQNTRSHKQLGKNQELTQTTRKNPKLIQTIRKNPELTQTTRKNQELTQTTRKRPWRSHKQLGKEPGAHTNNSEKNLELTQTTRKRT